MSIRNEVARCIAEGDDPDQFTFRAALAVFAGAVCGVALFLVVVFVLLLVVL